MGKSTRKHRKNREYEHIPEPTKASPYDIHVGKETQHVENDLLSSPREFVPLDQLSTGDASSFSVVMMLMATCVGACVVVIPYAFLQGGFTMTIFMMLFLALVTHFTRTRLVELGVEHGIYSLQGLAKLAFGARGAYVIGINQVIVSLGLITTYLMIVFDDIPIVLGHWLKMHFDSKGHPNVPHHTKAPLLKLLASRYWFAELFNLLVMLPLCLYARSNKRIRISSALVSAILTLTALSAMVKAHSIHEDKVAKHSQGYQRDYLSVPATLCQAFGILGTTFASQHHAFHNFYAIQQRTTNIFTRLSAIAMIGSLALGLSIGISGYVSFMSTTKPDVLQNYDFKKTNRSLLPFWFLVPLCAMICVTHEIIASRHTLQFLFRPLCGTRQPSHDDVLFDSQNHTTTVKKSLMEEHLLDDQPQSWTSHLLTTSVLIAVAQIATFYIGDIATVLSWSGGLAGLALCFVFPPLCQLKLATMGDPSQSPNGNWWCNVVWPYVSIVIGLVASVACVISLLVHAHMDSTV